jgi:hypothetical protein
VPNAIIIKSTVNTVSIPMAIRSRASVNLSQFDNSATGAACNKIKFILLKV